MKMILGFLIAILLGVLGGTCATHLGFEDVDFNWILICLPWWLLSVSINIKI